MEQTESILDVTNQDENSILGLECALSLQGYCTFLGGRVPIYLFEGKGYYGGTSILVGVESMPTKDELVRVDGRLMTTPERSIIDLLRYKPYSEYTIHALCLMENEPEVLKRTRELAKKYGLENELEQAIKESETWYDEG